MKKMLLVILVIAVFGIEGIGQQKKLKDLIGIWEIVGEDKGAYLEIIDSSTIILSYAGEKKKILEYNFDFQKSPIWFDFSASDTTSIVAVKSLLEVVGENMLKWQLFIDEDRTAYFSTAKGETLFLRKSTRILTPGLVSN